jgi:ABC-type sugar transport system substrate-binding protein
MKKCIILLVLCLVLTAILPACTAPGEPATTPESNTSAAAQGTGSGTRNVTLVLKNLINPFCVVVKEGAEQAAADHNINLTVLTPLQGDNNEELMQLTEQATASGECDVLIMFPSNSVAIIPAVRKTYEANIPVVMLNTNISNSTDEPNNEIWETFVACENWEVGSTIGHALAKKMDESGQVILIEGVAGAQNSLDRAGGAAEAIGMYPDMEIVASQPGDFNRVKAMEVMQNLLQTYPDVNGVIAMNDEMALGCIEAIEAAGKSEQIVVAGCDGNADARTAIKEGKLDLTCDLMPYDQGYQSVAAAARILNGEEVERNIVIQMKLIDASNIDEPA